MSQSKVEEVKTAVSLALRSIDDSTRVGELTDAEIEQIARAAIEAMKEPSVGMLMAAVKAEHEHFYPGLPMSSHTWKHTPIALLAKHHRAMITAALEEGE